MIRMVLSLFVFALTICLLIVLEPFQPPSTTGTDADQPEVEVTRAATENAPVSTPVSLPTAAPRAPGGLLTTDTTTRDLSSSVLADLGLASPDSGTPVAQPQNTAEYLASLQQGGNAPEPAPTTDLPGLVADALRDGQSDDDIDALVNQAASSGEVAVPRELVTSDGRVDTATLLSVIASDATQAAGLPQQVTPPQPIDVQGLEVRVVQRAEEAVQARFYTVQPGDSLGAIAQKMYGDANLYPQIFDANRSLLSSPDQIRTGQRLVVPDL